MVAKSTSSNSMRHDSVARQFAKQRKMTRVLSCAAAASAVAMVGFMAVNISRDSNAAAGGTASANGDFLAGSLLGIDLGAIVEISGASADYTASTTAANVISANPFNAEVLGLINLELPAISLPLGDLLQLGAVGQYAQALPGGISRAATGAVNSDGIIDTTGQNGFPADAALDLTEILPSAVTSTLLSEAGLELDAVTSVAHMDASLGATLANGCADMNAPSQCLDYSIAGAKLNITSPLVGGLVQTVDDAIGDISTIVTGLVESLQEDIIDTLEGALNSLGVLTVDLSATLDDTDLQAALSSVLSQTVTLNGVSINLSNGSISVDLAQLIDLNNLPVDSQLLTADVLQEIVDQVASALASLQDQINDLVNTALDNLAVDISGGASVDAGILGTAGVELSFDGSVSDLLDASAPIEINGTGLVSILDPVLSGLTSTIQGLTATLLSTAETVITDAGQLTSGVVAALTNQLPDVFAIINGVASITINSQNSAGGIHAVSAVQIDILSPAAPLAAPISISPQAAPAANSVATVKLATSTVGPNSTSTTESGDITLSATNTVVGQDTYINGGGWPANTEITLQLMDMSGANVGTAIIVHTDANGNLPANTNITVPYGTLAGTLQVAATPTGGQTTMAQFQAAPEGAPAIITPADGSTINNNQPTISGVGNPTETVTVTDENSQIVCTAFVSADGTWSCQATNPLVDGDHSLTATQTDGTNVSAPSNTVNITVDTTTGGGDGGDDGNTGGGDGGDNGGQQIPGTPNTGAFGPNSDSAAIAGFGAGFVAMTAAAITSRKMLKKLSSR